MHQKDRHRPKRKEKIVLILFFVGIGFLTIATLFGAYIAVLIRQLPSPEQFGSRQISQSTKLYDRTGTTLLYEIHGEEKRTVVPFDEIPVSVREATLAAEDANFYNEPAFDWRGILRAAVANIRAGHVTQGGSTISQQLAKNAFLSDERSFSRKLKELVLAIELESKYNKDQILNFYLNQIPYGSNAYGVEAASQTYFNKHVQDLSLAEAATLSSLIKAPSYFSPWGTHQKELLQRKDYVLDRMVDLGFITDKDRVSAKKIVLSFAPASLGEIKAPHFSLAVKDYLIGKYGEDEVLNGGLKVTTSLDWDLQQVAERVVADGAKRNEGLYDGKNSALVAQDPKTGQILALVGSRDYFDKTVDGNFNVAMQGLRQPGSALKPFAYLTAFERGFSPNTIVFDAETEFDSTGDPKNSYKPQNFDEQFRGPVTFAQGLAQSINVPSIKALYLAGFDNVLTTIHDCGVTTLQERWRYGLSLILGGGEVKLYDLINCYATLAQNGIRHDQTLVLNVEDSHGKTLETYHDNATKVIDPEYPKLITQILSDKNLRAPLFQNSLSLTTFPDREVALKTGTTNDYRDAWALGYTPSLAVGVWAGNNDNTPMQRHGSSILAAVPIWNAFLTEAFKKIPPEVFEKPDPLPPITKPMLNGQYIYSPIVGGKTYPQIHSILYYVDPSDPLGPPPANPGENSQYENWESGVIDWARKNIPNFSTDFNLPVPPGAGTQSVGQNNVVLVKNIAPTNGSFVASPFVASADISSSQEIKYVRVFLNSTLLGQINVSGNSYHLSYPINGPLSPQNLFEIKVGGADGIETISSVVFFSK